MVVSGIPIQVVRKSIKNLHLGVYPPEGRVRIAVPMMVNDDAVRLAVVDKLSWIRRRQAHFLKQPRQSKREMVTGESHYFQGKRYRLRIAEENVKPSVLVKGVSTLILTVRPGTTTEKREEILNEWYRRELKAKLPDLIAKWQPIVGVDIAETRIKKMRTRWGTCNIGAKRIWLNLELAKKPTLCLEYILVHEMAHLLERHHNERFKGLMDKFMPQWRFYRDGLNSTPLAFEDWKY